MVEKLPSDWSVLGIDLPGHGKSELPKDLYSTMGGLYGLDDFSKILYFFSYSLRYLIDELGWSKSHLVCHSMGTFVGTQYACLYPDHIDSLTLLDYPGEALSGFIQNSNLQAKKPSFRNSNFQPANCADLRQNVARVTLR